MEYGIGTSWRFNVEANGKIELYTGRITQEDEISLMIYTIKDETRSIRKSDIKSSVKLFGDLNERNN